MDILVAFFAGFCMGGGLLAVTIKGIMECSGEEETDEEKEKA